jgi:hypothetical protein
MPATSGSINPSGGNGPPQTEDQRRIEPKEASFEDGLTHSRAPGP